MDDDDFSELMRRADPAQDIHDSRNEADFQEDLADVYARASSARRQRRLWVALPAAAATVATLIAFQLWSGGNAHAHAATPPLLKMAAVAENPEQVLTRAKQSLNESPGVPAGRRAESEGWYINTELDTSGEPVSVVAPQRRIAQWESDLSGRILVTAGEAYLPKDGRQYPPPPGTAPTPGTVLSDERYPAGQMPLVFPGEPPTTADRMRAYLEAGGASPSYGAVSYIDSVRTLLDEWTLNDAQQAAVLEVLLGLDEVEVAGNTNDRLDRQSTAIRVRSAASPHLEYLLLIQRDTGRIGALETIYLGGLTELDLPVPSVTAYISWR